MEEKLTFINRAKFREWLEKNHDTHGAIWIVLGKKDRLETLSADEALQEALCFGWIDGLIKSIDDTCYIKRFSHRRKKSIWSDRNKNFVKKLIANGDMTAFGLEEIERAKINRTWNPPKAPPLSQETIEKFKENVNGNEPAYTNLLNMPESVQKIYAMHWSGAKKEETRQRRLGKIIERLNNNLKPM